MEAIDASGAAAEDAAPDDGPYLCGECEDACRDGGKGVCDRCGGPTPGASLRLCAGCAALTGDCASCLQPMDPDRR